MSDFINTLFALIEDRKANPQPDSYTNKLLDRGLDKITQKVGEEAVEVVIAAHSQTDERLIEEYADLVYHSLVLLAYKGLTPDDIRAELQRRHQPRTAE
jgi:phosphoribosyl-ATP pyrophosphohydrolase